MRRSPASTRAWAMLARAWTPLVVMARSTRGRRRRAGRRAARPAPGGGPAPWARRPVRRMPSKPKRSTKTRAMRAVSSKVRISSRASHSMPSSGMQYVHRKLQRSVTEMRRSRWTRPKLSTSCCEDVMGGPRYRGRPAASHSDRRLEAPARLGHDERCRAGAVGVARVVAGIAGPHGDQRAVGGADAGVVAERRAVGGRGEHGGRRRRGSARSCRVTMVGGASWISPSSRRRSISAGRTHSSSWISPPSMVTSPASPTGARHTKNQVAKRLGPLSATLGRRPVAEQHQPVGLDQQVGFLERLADRRPGARRDQLVAGGVGGRRRRPDRSGRRGTPTSRRRRAWSSCGA